MALGAMLAVSATTASAVTASSFVFGSGPDDQSSLTFSATTGTGSVTVEALRFNVNQSSTGLGVSGGGPVEAADGRIGVGLFPEGLTFTFDSAVTLWRVDIFEHEGGVEKVGLFDADSVLLEELSVSGDGPSSSTQRVLLNGGEGYFGTSFTFTHRQGSGVRIKRLHVETIPLPPAILGVVSAFALAFGVKRVSRSA